MIDSGKARISTSSEEGDEGFEHLFESQWPRLMNVLIRMTGDRSRAEDLAQETFLRLHRQQSRLENPAAWLYRVAFRLGLDALRNEKNRGRREQVASSWGNSPVAPDVLLEHAERQKLARRVLGRMPTRFTQVLILRYSGLSFAEIAELGGLRASSIGTLLNRAERDFKKRYLRLSKGAKP